MRIYYLVINSLGGEYMKNIPLYDVREISDLRDLLVSSTKIYGDKTAFLVKKGGSEDYSPISFNQFYDDVTSFGTALMDLGLKGKRVAVIGENRYEWLVAYMAAVNGVGVVVPIDRMLPENEIESALKRSKASAVVFSNYNREFILSILQREKFLEYAIGMDYDSDKEDILSYHALVKKGRESLKAGNRDFMDAEIDKNALGILLFTSATTDKAKAVMLSHSNIAQNLMAMSKMINIKSTDIFLSVLPIHHTYECTCGFMCAFYRGAAIAICEGLRHIAKNMKESKTSVLLAVPLILETMYKKIWEQASKSGLDKKLKTGIKISSLAKKFGLDISKKLFAKVHDSFGGNVRLLISGAAGIDPDVSKGFRDLGLTVLQGYGLTECSPILALNRDVDFKDDAAGLPLLGVDIKIADANEEGIGEIIARGPNIMLGYYDDEEATSHVIIDGWFHTGDLGFIDSDGFVHITGRKKNVIVTKNGKNIYPEEIETLLCKSPYIKECIVSGKDDEGDGDIVVFATIVPDYETIELEFALNPLTEEQIHDLVHKAVKEVNKRLVTYKYIRDFDIRKDEFEKTTTRKIKRYKA